MNPKTLFFKLITLIDLLINVLTGGDFDTYFSTRCYINSRIAKPLYRRKRWDKIRAIVDRIMFEKNHCMYSYYWDREIKRRWDKRFGELE